MTQHAILRFEKHKGNPARPLEAHHERQKEQYASNPDIDTSRSKYNFHIVKRRDAITTSFRAYRAGRMPDEERQHTVYRYADNRQPGVFQGEIPKGDTGVLPAGGGLPHPPGRPGKYRVGGGTHGRENTPPAFDLCSADKGQPPVCKGDYRQPGKPDEVQTIFTPIWWRNILTWSVGRVPADRPEAYPHPAFQTGVSLSKQARAIEANWTA